MMSREIKFRAWDKDNEQFIPDYFTIGNDGVIDIIDCLARNKPCWPEEQFIVEQYTGLKDKNGKDIYEGDIITRPYRDVIVTGTVVFSDGFSSFKTEFDSSSIDGVKSKTLVPFMPHEMDQIEILGNIHKSPELLTQLEKK